MKCQAYYDLNLEKTYTILNKSKHIETSTSTCFILITNILTIRK